MKTTPNVATIRRPTAQGESNHTAMQDAWADVMLPAGIKLYNLLAQPRTYEAMSNINYKLNPRAGGQASWSEANRRIGTASLEAFHGAGHSWAGKPSVPNIVLVGHMNELPYSSFDPFFWLHHWFVVASVQSSVTNVKQ